MALYSLSYHMQVLTADQHLVLGTKKKQSSLVHVHYAKNQELTKDLYPYLEPCLYRAPLLSRLFSLFPCYWHIPHAQTQYYQGRWESNKRETKQVNPTIPTVRRLAPKNKRKGGKRKEEHVKTPAFTPYIGRQRKWCIDQIKRKRKKTKKKKKRKKTQSC